MAPPANDPAPSLSGLTPEERRWLHDKYERLAGDEASLADSRTSYFAAIASALVAALVVLVINELRSPALFVTMASLLAAFGMLIAGVWTIVLRRTTAALTLWRESALLLEEGASPITTPLPATVSLRAGHTIEIDLTQPYRAHQTRFVTAPGISWIDRVRPSELSANVPFSIVVLWALVLVGSWTWYLVLQ
jgi:hypothetical protein